MKNKTYKIFLVAVLLLFTAVSMWVIATDKKSAKISQQTTSSSQTTSTSSSVDTVSDLPDVSSEDWELILVNRNHVWAEMNPTLADIGGISLDARIVENAQNFLAAAQAIDPNEHLISGYRSVAYQEELFSTYLQQEMANDPSLSEAEAVARVKTYSQPAGASEHMTGLAMDMSTVDSLNESDATVASQVQALAPSYGFVLRFPEGKSDVTGVDYEDWHYRYVGVESAKYMTEHNLTLEEYVALLKENGK